MRRDVTALAVAALAWIAAPALAGTPAAGFTDTLFVGGLSAPTAIAFLPNGTLLITEQGGALKLFDGSNTTTLATIPVCNSSEMGLLGVAVDPNFSSNGFIYLYRTLPGAGDCGTSTGRFNQVVRVTLVGGSVNLASLTQLLTGIRTDNGNHDGGVLRMGPDQKIWVGAGDSGLGDNNSGPGSATNPYAQDLTSLNGKILRLNLDGTVPSDNPFVGTAGARGEIWAYGFRNPFRMSFDGARLWIGDVGDLTIEEIDIGVAGGNYSWPRCEGNLQGPPDAPQPCVLGTDIAPAFTYPHSGSDSLGTCVIGGAFAGSAFGPLAGDYVFGDCTSSSIYHVGLNAGRTGFAGTPAQVATNASTPSDFVRGPDGAVYYTAESGGAVRRLAANIPTPTNTPAPSNTSVPTSTITRTRTQTPTLTPTTTPSSTPPFTSTATPPFTPTATVPFTPTATAPFTPTATAPFTPTATPPFTPTATAPSTPTVTAPFTPTATLPFTPTATAPSTPTVTAPFTPTATPATTPTLPTTVTCGNTVQVNGNHNPGWNNLASGIPCTVGTNPGGYRIDSCHLYAEVASGQIRCAIYNNNPDPNKALLCESAPITAVPGWNTVPLTCPTITANTQLWVAGNVSASAFRYGLTTGVCNQPNAAFYRTAAFGPFPQPWGVRASANCALSLYAALSPLGGGATPTFTPTATSTPVPTSTATPLPTNTPMSPPTNTATPLPTDTSTPLPTNTAPPLPTNTSTPLPTSTVTGVPTPTATPPLTPLTPTATAGITPTLPATVTCGNTVQVNGNHNPGWNNLASGIPCTAGANPGGYRIDSCRLYAEVASGQIRCAIYNNNPDPNKGLLCESAPITAVPGWNTVPLTCPTITANTQLWVAGNVSASAFRYGLTTGVCNQPNAAFYRTAAFGPFPQPWGVRASANCALSLYAVLSPLGGGGPPATLLR